LKTNKIEIAHNISIGFFKKEFANLLNQRNLIDISNGDEFAEEILSTDDEDITNFHNFLGTVKNAELTPIVINSTLNFINAFLTRLNRASKNLMPGHSSPNRSIQENRDPHTIKRDGRHEETEISKKITTKTNKFFLNRAEPNSRYVDGSIQYQSSSVHESFGSAWFTPAISPPEPSYQTCLNLFSNFKLSGSRSSSDSEEESGYSAEHESSEEELSDNDFWVFETKSDASTDDDSVYWDSDSDSESSSTRTELINYYSSSDDNTDSLSEKSNEGASTQYDSDDLTPTSRTPH
jgi:hypothetical protein